jgi:P27 family predicted phage terminase small subunit
LVFNRDFLRIFICFNSLGEPMNQTSADYKAITGAKPRKSRASAKVNSTASASTPSCPRWLGKDARQEWQRITPMLAKRGTLTRVDSMTIAVYCNAVARYVAAQRSIDADGVTVTVTVHDSHGKATEAERVNPALKIVESCERTIHKFLREFGGTPRSREQTKPAQPAPLPANKMTDREKAIANADRLLALPEGECV